MIYEASISSAGIFNRYNAQYSSDMKILSVPSTFDLIDDLKLVFGMYRAITYVQSNHIYQDSNEELYYEILNKKIIEDFISNLPLIEARRKFFQQDATNSPS